MASSDNQNVNEVSRVSAHSYYKGNFYSDNDIRIDGTFEGDILTKGKAVVGEKARVLGTIICASLDVWGNIKGDVYVKDTLSLKATSTVEGNMYYTRLQLEIGANFEGMCKRVAEDDYKAMFESKDIRLQPKEQ
ncbi:MAG: polymer-forming cytoskeletal protein [Bacteroidales bacterium]|jgi:cytoskeletal protein CcmA (bactofilin family)|nr:polymer-forming cytoskeletal protein [Bacteroidales bacterium]MBQ1905051.1 polymer-forming cytoskeletal protein [Bacteroidales bacterium]MBQ2103586.1 polymer-forming cytoskeletal protein [Bacteroidales bacterium]MBQ2502685.1 polymer-forming cytoskeletal protein [Bacteroidales bacterium]MBQ3975812.1 polymer-forming cytoskeletal protein [Bacteroidales bacterium]